MWNLRELISQTLRVEWYSPFYIFFLPRHKKKLWVLLCFIQSCFWLTFHITPLIAVTTSHGCPPHPCQNPLLTVPSILCWSCPVWKLPLCSSYYLGGMEVPAGIPPDYLRLWHSCDFSWMDNFTLFEFWKFILSITPHLRHGSLSHSGPLMHEGLSCFGGQEEERYEGRENGHASEDRAGPLPSVNSWLMGCFSNHFFLRENLPLRG